MTNKEAKALLQRVLQKASWADAYVAPLRNRGGWAVYVYTERQGMWILDHEVVYMQWVKGEDE